MSRRETSQKIRRSTSSWSAAEPGCIQEPDNNRSSGPRSANSTFMAIKLASPERGLQTPAAFDGVCCLVQQLRQHSDSFAFFAEYLCPSAPFLCRFCTIALTLVHCMHMLDQTTAPTPGSSAHSRPHRDGHRDPLPLLRSPVRYPAQCGRGRRHRGSATPDFPVNKGALCIKGFTAHETLAHADRLRTPLVRNDRRHARAGLVGRRARPDRGRNPRRPGPVWGSTPSASSAAAR